MGKAILVPNITFSSNLGKVTCEEWPYNAIDLKAQSGMVGSAQGSAVYGDILFGGYKDDARIRIYNLQTCSTVQPDFIIPDSAVTGRHMNSLCFGHLKYDNADEYPLLYGGGNLDALENIIDIYRVVKSDNAFSITRVGSIDVSMLGYVDVAYWDDKLVLCGNKIYIVNPPAANDMEHVLTSSDIVTQYERGTVRRYIQQPGVHNDYLYIPYCSTYTSKGTYDYMMKVMDLNTGNVVMDSEFNYNKNYGIEFEAVITWNNNLYIVHNNGGYSVNLCRV